MSKFGVNVPPGIPVFSLNDIDDAASQMKSPDGQVSLFAIIPCLTSTVLLCNKDHSKSKQLEPTCSRSVPRRNCLSPHKLNQA